MIIAEPTADQAADVIAINHLAVSYAEAVSRLQIVEAVETYAVDGVRASPTTDDAVPDHGVVAPEVRRAPRSGRGTTPTWTTSPRRRSGISCCDRTPRGRRLAARRTRTADIRRPSPGLMWAPDEGDPLANHRALRWSRGQGSAPTERTPEVPGQAIADGPVCADRARTRTRHRVGRADIRCDMARPGIPRPVATRPRSCASTAAMGRTRRWTGGRSFASTRPWSTSVSTGTSGSDTCCTTTSRGRPRRRCPGITAPQTTSQKVCGSRVGHGTDSSVTRHRTTAEPWKRAYVTLAPGSPTD